MSPLQYVPPLALRTVLFCNTTPYTVAVVPVACVADADTEMVN